MTDTRKDRTPRGGAGFGSSSEHCGGESQSHTSVGTAKRLEASAVVWDRPTHLTRADVFGNPSRWRIYVQLDADGSLDGTFLLRDPLLGAGCGLATTAEVLQAQPMMYDALPPYVARTLRSYVARYFAERALVEAGATR